MKNKYNQRVHCTPYQLKLPLEISKKIKISDPVYTFCEVFDRIDLNKNLAVKESRTGRKRYDSEILLKVILFAFMEFGYTSTREIEKLCNNDIRFMWLLQDESAPSHMTIDNFMNETLLGNLNSIHGALLRMNRSIQAEGAFGAIKWNKSYQRIHRRGLKSVTLEISMISCGFNLHKYHLKSLAQQLAA